MNKQHKKMRNTKQWTKAVMAIIIGIVPISISGYVHATWYYILLTVCSLFAILGITAFFQLLIYTVLFPNLRNSFVKTLFGLSIVLTLAIPFTWIYYNESHPERLLENNYEITEAHISKITRENEHFNVNYEFEVSGKQYKTSTILKKEPVSSTFYIKYLPSNPEINEPAEY
jgi:hypothetical protein